MSNLVKDNTSLPFPKRNLRRVKPGTDNAYYIHGDKSDSWAWGCGYCPNS